MVVSNSTHVKQNTRLSRCGSGQVLQPLDKSLSTNNSSREVILSFENRVFERMQTDEMVVGTPSRGVGDLESIICYACVLYSVYRLRDSGPSD